MVCTVLLLWPVNHWYGFWIVVAFFSGKWNYKNVEANNHLFLSFNMLSTVTCVYIRYVQWTYYVRIKNVSVKNEETFSYHTLEYKLWSAQSLFTDMNNCVVYNLSKSESENVRTLKSTFVIFFLTCCWWSSCYILSLIIHSIWTDPIVSSAYFRKVIWKKVFLSLDSALVAAIWIYVELVRNQ